jgi:hypothetical protein
MKYNEHIIFFKLLYVVVVSLRFRLSTADFFEEFLLQVKRIAINLETVFSQMPDVDFIAF